MLLDPVAHKKVMTFPLPKSNLGLTRCVLPALITTIFSLSLFQTFSQDFKNLNIDSLIEVLDSTLQADFSDASEISRAGITQTLHINYDGNIVKSELVIYGNDTCELIQQLMNRRFVPLNFDCYLFHNEIREGLYNCSGEDNLEKDQSKVTYVSPLCPINTVINGYDSLRFRLAANFIDTIVFSYSGKDQLEQPFPVPYYFRDNKIIWLKEDLIVKDDHVEIRIKFEGPSLTFLNFSRAEIQKYNENMSSWFGDMAQNILLALPFWILWILCYSNQRRFSRFAPEIIRSILKWMPVLSGFYFLIIILGVYEEIDSSIHRVGITSAEENIFRIKSRLFGIVFAGIALFSSYLLKQKRGLWLSFTSRILATLGWSIIAFVLLGLINYSYQVFTPFSDRYWTFSDATDLQIYLRYPFGVLIPGYVFLFVCFFNLFRFERKMALLLNSLLLLLLITQIYDALSFPIDRMVGTNVMGLFFAHYFLLPFFPFILAWLLISKIIKSNPSNNALAALGSFYILFFCFYSVYPGTIFLLPITFIVALFIGNKLFANSTECSSLVRVGNRIVELEKQEKKHFKKFFDIKQFENLKKIYNNKFLSGEMTSSERNKAIAELRNPSEFSDSLTTRAVTERLRFGPSGDCLENALKVAIIAFIIALVVFSIYFKAYFKVFAANGSDVLDVFFPALKYGFGGFCIGLFFPFISGDLGWKKGFWFALAITAAELPYEYVTSQSGLLFLIIGSIMKQILIFTLTGFIVDLLTIIKIYGKEFRLRYILQIEGWKNILWFGSVLAGAVLAGFLALLSENFGYFLSGFFK